MIRQMWNRIFDTYYKGNLILFLKKFAFYRLLVCVHVIHRILICFLRIVMIVYTYAFRVGRDSNFFLMCLTDDARYITGIASGCKFKKYGNDSCHQWSISRSDMFFPIFLNSFHKYNKIICSNCSNRIDKSISCKAADSVSKNRIGITKSSAHHLISRI